MSLSLHPEVYAHWVAALVAVGIAIDSLEVLYSRQEYSREGIFSWDILRLDNRFASTGRGAWILQKLLGFPGYIVLIALQLGLAGAIVAPTPSVLLPVCTTALLIIKLLTHLRSAHGGLDGSDQMQIVILASLGAFYWTADSGVRVIALSFIAAQAMLSYVAAGVAKLASPMWRRGEAIVGIFATDSYGSEAIGTWLRRSTLLAKSVCWAVIAFECLAPVAVFGGPTLCLVFIGCATLFHLTIAAVMGLNNFLWSFGAALPALLFASTHFG